MERTPRCDEARLLMIDGLAEVPPRPPAPLAAHLAACPDCRSEWESLAGTVTALGRFRHGEENPAGPAADRGEGATRASGAGAPPAGDRVILARLWTAVERRVRQTPQEVPPRRASPVAPGEPAEAVPLSLGWRLVNYSYLLVLAICLYAGLASCQPHFLEAAALLGLPVDSWLVADYGIFLLFYAVGGFSALLAAPLLIKGKDDPHPFVAWVGRQFGLLTGRMGVLACW